LNIRQDKGIISKKIRHNFFEIFIDEPAIWVWYTKFYCVLKLHSINVLFTNTLMMVNSVGNTIYEAQH